MNKIMVTSRAALDELIGGSALTWEGLRMETDEDYKSVTDWMREKGAEPKTNNVYITMGKTMNELEGLTGSNAYPDDLTIVSFKLSEIDGVKYLILPMRMTGGRWMDDIVNNNRDRENN